MVVVNELISITLLLWEDEVVLKELICNSFLFGRVWWSLNVIDILTVS